MLAPFRYILRFYGIAVVGLPWISISLWLKPSGALSAYRLYVETPHSLHNSHMCELIFGITENKEERQTFASYQSAHLEKV
ncbi:hypothetical protein F5884DRAFT_108741 [Xylogone sp. PMI_703]|nr:hypothetical protein F5884DRAFT_108741 [Xylogone sp. PMI_703]